MEALFITLIINTGDEASKSSTTVPVYTDHRKNMITSFMKQKL